ncbi:MAG: hypothetical protein ACTSPW_17605 [Promethearchaeota archaeon]
MSIDSLFDHIKKEYSDIIDVKCQEIGQNKRLSLGNLKKNSIIFCIEKKKTDKSKCDCIILTFLKQDQSFYIFFIELKSTFFKISKVYEQIQSCAYYFQELIKKDEIFREFLKKYNCSFYPILISDPIDDIADKYVKSRKSKKKPSKNFGVRKKILIFLANRQIKFFNKENIITPFKYLMPDNRTKITLDIILKSFKRE